MIFKTAPKGQALILIALAAVGLFGLAALAIDGSAVYSDRRHAQNAADTGAFAAALDRVRGKTDAEWKQAAIDRVSSNGYETDGVNEVKVYTCLEWKTSADNPTGADCKALPAGAVPDEYVYVRIKSVVHTYFARVIGRFEVINYSDAIVHASPIEITEWFDGFAMVSANMGCAVGGDFPFDAGGSGVTVINNSGVFVNSSCAEAFKDDGSKNRMTTDRGICIVGGIKGSADGFYDGDGNIVPPDDHCGNQIDITQYWMPDTDPGLLAPYCATAGIFSESGSEYIATPGRYAGAFPPNGKSPGTLRLQKGVYCFDSGISLNGNWEITTDVNNNGLFDSATEGIFFYVRNGDVTFNGGSVLELYSMTNPAGGWPPQILNYFMYIPASNDAEVKLTGSNGSTFKGLILAPTANIEILGNGEALSLHTQIIGSNTKITGSGTVDITYNPNDVPPAVIMPRISPTE